MTERYLDLENLKHLFRVTIPADVEKLDAEVLRMNAPGAFSKIKTALEGGAGTMLKLTWQDAELAVTVGAREVSVVQNGVTYKAVVERVEEVAEFIHNLVFPPAPDSDDGGDGTPVPPPPAPPAAPAAVEEPVADAPVEATTAGN